VEAARSDELTRATEEMRSAFVRGDWDVVVDLFEGISDEFKGARQLRLEATCLAARAWAALNDRSKARALIQPLAKAEYKKPIHYEFLARAFLDLKQYEAAARACEKAHSLRPVEIAGDAPQADAAPDHPAAS